jgi:hypothetical protein
MQSSRKTDHLAIFKRTYHLKEVSINRHNHLVLKNIFFLIIKIIVYDI